MPQLPSYDSSRNIKPQLSAPLRDEAAQMAANQNKITGTITAIAQQWSDANDVMQYTKFKADSETAIARQKAVAEADPNENNWQAHYDALKEIKQNSTGMISNKMVEQKALLELDHSLAVAQIEISSTFKKKQILTNEIKLNEYAKTMAVNKSKAPTYAASLQIDDEFETTIKKNVVQGLITEAKGRKMIEDYRLGGVDLDIMNDEATAKEDSYVYAQLKKGEKGIYKDLSEAERAERLQKTELHIRRNKIMNNYMTNKNQDVAEKDLLKNHGSNAITEGEVKNQLISTAIRPGFGDKYIAKMYEPPAEKTEYGAYNKIKELQLSGKKEKEINEAILNNLGNLTVEDKNALLENQYNSLDEKTINLKASVQALADWAIKTFPPEEANEIVYNFLQKVDKSPSADIDGILKSTQQGYIRKFHPSTTLLNDTPNIIGTRNRIRSVYKKESKAKGTKVSVKPASTVYQSMDVNFEDL
jgi:hypothetical protein